MPYASRDDRLAASRRHYARNAAEAKARAAAFSITARERNRAYVASVKADVACADCGVCHPPHVMQFDHLGNDKDRAVARLVAVPVSLARLQAEITKCELVCANCHAVRTHSRRTALDSH